MPSGSKFTPYRVAIEVLLTVLLVSTAAFGPQALAQAPEFSIEGLDAPPELIIEVGDTIGHSGQKNSVITVFMTNTFDSVVAFELLLRIGNREICEFQSDSATVYDTTWWLCSGWDGPTCTSYVASDYETTYWVCDSVEAEICVDSSQVPVDSAWEWFWVADSMLVDTVEVVVGSIETEGTLIEGWEEVSSRSVIREGEDIKVTAQADRLTIPGTTPGIPPQQGGVLFRLLADIKNLDPEDTLRTSAIIPDPWKQHFSFSDPDGNGLGESDSLVVDTDYYHCESWVPPDYTTCSQWVKVFPWEEYDSMAINTDTVFYIDFEKTWLFNGSINVLSGVCGQLDGDLAYEIDIGDLTFMIAYLFLDGEAPEPMGIANMDCSADGVVDVGDLTYFIRYLFMEGDPPGGDPACPECQ
ncbi:MAG TPA: hypothetical protein VMY05_11665 [Acidobacteriota bacterium]|nr:hypothetical protein [Acidobacteriota bacterium]